METPRLRVAAPRHGCPIVGRYTPENVFALRKAAAGKAMQQTDDLTRRALAMVANVTGGMSPQAFAGAWFTVLGRLATSPGRQAELARQVLTKSVAMAQFAGGALGGRAPDAEGTPYASRFSGPGVEQVSLQPARAVVPDGLGRGARGRARGAGHGHRGRRTRGLHAARGTGGPRAGQLPADQPEADRADGAGARSQPAARRYAISRRTSSAPSGTRARPESSNTGSASTSPCRRAR